MKKIILVMVMMACYLSQINAQVHFGLKAGLNFDNFKMKNVKIDPPTLKNSSGWQAGALLQFKVPVVGLGVQPELLYTVCKTNIDQATNKIHYFEVPVNLQWGLNLLLVRPYLQGGPYFGYALKSDGTWFEDKINKFDWGIALGAGVEVWKLQLSGRYQWGLQNVTKVTDFDLKNRRFNLSLGFLF